MTDRSPSLERLIAAIPGDSPVGEDPKYLPDSEYVKAEIAKTSSRDWERIVAACESVLGNSAKDITLLCYLLVSGAVHKGWTAAAEAAMATVALCEAHWDSIHPTRDRARQNAFRWLVEERTLGTLEQVGHSDSDHEPLVALAGALEGLQAVLNAKFPADAPALRPLIQQVQDRAQATRPATPTPATQPSAAPTEAVTTPSSSSVAMPDMAPDGATRSDLLAALQKGAMAMISAAPDSPFGYRLLRMVRWQDLTAAPRAEGGMTKLPPPNPQRRAWFESQVQQRAWGQILEKCEAAFTEPGLHFWIDLQSYAFQALQGKGADSVAEAVRSELKALLTRVPQLADLKYADGTPFASVSTKAWIDEILVEGRGAAATSSAAREETLESDLESARALLAAGEAGQALALLEAGLPYGSGRSRSQRKLELARLALQAGKVRAALALAAELSAMAGRMDLACWEPELSAAIAEVHLKALCAAIDTGAGDTALLKTVREELAARIGANHPSLLARIDF